MAQFRTASEIEDFELGDEANPQNIIVDSGFDPDFSRCAIRFGTEDFYLSVSTLGTSNHTWVHFRVASPGAGDDGVLMRFIGYNKRTVLEATISHNDIFFGSIPADLSSGDFVDLYFDNALGEFTVFVNGDEIGSEKLEYKEPLIAISSVKNKAEIVVSEIICSDEKTIGQRLMTRWPAEAGKTWDGSNIDDINKLDVGDGVSTWRLDDDFTWKNNPIDKNLVGNRKILNVAMTAVLQRDETSPDAGQRMEFLIGKSSMPVGVPRNGVKMTRTINLDKNPENGKSWDIETINNTVFGIKS
jgi:hypothetical protein